MIDIGKIVNKVLTDNGIGCYPIVAPENSSLPLVIYERTFTADDTKDGRGIDNNTIDIYVLTDDYKEAITLSMQIEDLIAAVKGDVLGTRVIKSKLVAGAEMYESGAYIQRLTFEIKTAA